MKKPKGKTDYIQLLLDQMVASGLLSIKTGAGGAPVLNERGLEIYLPNGRPPAETLLVLKTFYVARSLFRSPGHASCPTGSLRLCQPAMQRRSSQNPYGLTLAKCMTVESASSGAAPNGARQPSAGDATVPSLGLRF